MCYATCLGKRDEVGHSHGGIVNHAAAGPVSRWMPAQRARGTISNNS